MAANVGVVTTGDPGHSTTEHSPVGGLAHDTRGGISNPILGMILFICSEVMFFSGLFAAYFSVRASAVHWPPITEDTHLNEHFNLQWSIGRSLRDDGTGPELLLQCYAQFNY